MIDRPFISQFSPQRTDPEALEQILVQRHDLLAESVERVRESVLTKNKHHLLFIGPRGAGKTHLVTLIHHRLRQQADLQDKLCFAWLNEDEIATTFLKLLILIYRDLSQRYPADFPEKDLKKIYGMKPEIAQETLGNSLLKSLGKRTLVVIMENLDALFKEMDHKEQLNWRSFIQNHPVFTTVGTAQSLFDEVAERKEPFFGFFNTQHLDTLSVNEAITLLKNIAKLNGRDDLHDFLDTPTGQARVHAIHDLAGGNPRIYIIFSDFLTRESLDDLVRPFEETADRQLTSYYQERLRWLSAQQREIVQYLCHQRHPVPVKQIAEGLFATHNTITNQLKQLRDLRYVKGNDRGREVLYELAEPLMRLALQVKETHDRQPLRLIVDFLRVWYDRGDIEQRIGTLEPGSTVRCYFEAALAILDSDEPNLRHIILKQCLEGLDPERYDETSLASLQCLAEETDDAKHWLKLVKVYENQGNNKAAISALDHIIRLPSAGLYANVVNAKMASIYCKEGLYAKAIEKFTTVINHSETSQKLRVRSMLIRGHAYDMISMHDRGLKDLNEVVRYLKYQPTMLKAALISRAGIHRNLGQRKKTLADYVKATKIKSTPDVDLAAFRLLAQYYVEEGLDSLAEISFQQALSTVGVKPYSLSITLLKRAIFLAGSGNFFSAMEDVSKAIEMGSLQPSEYREGLLLRATLCLADSNFMQGISDLERVLSLPYDMTFEKKLHEIFPMLPDIYVYTSFVSQPMAIWGAQIADFSRYFAMYNMLPQLGDSLIQFLPDLVESPLNHEAYDAWADAWTAGAQTLSPEDQQQMEIPLRLLRAGIAYYKTKDEGTLLSLASEERKILRQVLKLDPEV